MSTFPNAAEVRSGMRRIKVAADEIERLQKAQIAQAVFGAKISDRVRLAQAVVVALGSMNDAICLYLLLLGLDDGEEFPPVVEEAR